MLVYADLLFGDGWRQRRVPDGGRLGKHDRILGSLRRDVVREAGESEDGDDAVRQPRADKQRYHHGSNLHNKRMHYQSASRISVDIAAVSQNKCVFQVGRACKQST